MNAPAIPDEYSGYADAIKATLKNTINLKLHPNQHSKRWESKVGGIPYLPLTEQYPLNSDGEPMLFLAQLNFAEIPHIEDWPKEGIVQFYIDGHDDLMGLYDDGFRVLYFKDIEKDESKLRDDMNKFTFPCAPLEKDITYTMSFSLDSQYMSTSDYRFGQIGFGEIWDMYDGYNDVFPAHGHRIGGYPHFTQTDPRTDTGDLKDYELLFQLDSDENIMWGDMGVGAFFIKPDDLKKLDFSKCLYNWDCC